MVDYFSVGVRAILHSVKDLIEALLNPSQHARLNGLTGMVSAESRILYAYGELSPASMYYVVSVFYYELECCSLTPGSSCSSPEMLHKRLKRRSKQAACWLSMFQPAKCVRCTGCGTGPSVHQFQGYCRVWCQIESAIGIDEVCVLPLDDRKTGSSNGAAVA